jgi:hypothetical protein
MLAVNVRVKAWERPALTALGETASVPPVS